MALVGAQVRAGLLDLVQVPADVAHVVHDERAVAEQHAEELRIADAQDDALHQVVEAEGRVGHAGLQEQHAQARDRVDRGEREDQRAEEPRQPKRRAATASRPMPRLAPEARRILIPEMIAEDRHRHGDQEQSREFERRDRTRVRSAPHVRALDRAIVGGRLDSRASRDSACRPARAGRFAATRRGRAACRRPSRCRCRCTLASPTKALLPISTGPMWMKFDCAR